VGIFPGLAAKRETTELYPVYLPDSSSPATNHSPLSRFPWFAIRVKSNFEKRVTMSLISKGVDAFLPEYKTRRRWSDRYKTIDCPLFPGYAFCRIDLQHRLMVVSTPGFLYIVSTGSKPTPVDEAEISKIQAVAHSGLSALPFPTLAVGQKVRLVNGPLTGLEATLLELGKHRRVYVGLTLLKRGVSVEVDSEWILPIRHSDPLVCAVKSAVAQSSVN